MPTKVFFLLERKNVILSVTLLALFLVKATPSLAAVNFQDKNFSLKASPAGSISEPVLVENSGSTVTNATFSWQGYQLDKASAVNDLATAKHSIDFASVSPNSLTLEPQATATVNVILSLPTKILPGDYYGTLLVNSDQGTDEASFVIRVAGTYNEKIDTTTVVDDGKSLSVGVANRGNISVIVSTSAKLHNLFGRSYELSADEVTIRANEIKTVTIAHPSLEPGLWQEEINFLYGQKNTPYSSFTSFWVNPYLFVVPFALILLALSLVYLFTLKNRG